MFNEKLTAFVCVADCGSFNKAAEKLYISAPSVMKQINALEKHLGLKLFDRTNHGIRLTPAGQVIYKHAKYLFAYSEKILEEAEKAQHADEMTFRIGSSLLNPCKPFMDLWYKVNSKFPGYNLRIVPFDDDHEDILSEIAALGDKYDFLLAACDSANWLELCNFKRLGEYRLCCAVSREHPLAKKELITFDELRGETLMMVKRGDSHAVDAFRRKAERVPSIHIEDTAQFYDIEVFNRCAQTKNVLLSLECWDSVHPGLVTIPIDFDRGVPYGVLYAKNAPADVLRFLSALDTVT